MVRARVPNIDIDDVFRKKDDIADAVKNELALVMGDFGYGIVKALVTDIEPDARVKAAMNEINAAQRLRLAAAEKGEADKILKVKAAEAEQEAGGPRVGARVRHDPHRGILTQSVRHPRRGVRQRPAVHRSGGPGGCAGGRGGCESRAGALRDIVADRQNADPRR